MGYDPCVGFALDAGEFRGQKRTISVTGASSKTKIVDTAMNQQSHFYNLPSYLLKVGFQRSLIFKQEDFKEKESKRVSDPSSLTDDGRNYSRQGVLSEEIFGPVECKCKKTHGLPCLNIRCPECGSVCSSSEERSRSAGYFKIGIPTIPNKRFCRYISRVLDIETDRLIDAAFYNQPCSVTYKSTVSGPADGRFCEDQLYGLDSIKSVLDKIDVDSEFHAIGDKIRRTPNRDSSALFRDLERVQVLHGLIISKIKPVELLSTILPIPPAGLRDMLEDRTWPIFNNIYRSALLNCRKLDFILDRGMRGILCGPTTWSLYHDTDRLSGKSLNVPDVLNPMLLDTVGASSSGENSTQEESKRAIESAKRELLIMTFATLQLCPPSRWVEQIAEASGHVDASGNAQN